MNIALTNGRRPLGLGRRFLLLAGLFVASVELAHSSETPALIESTERRFRPDSNLSRHLDGGHQQHRQRPTEFHGRAGRRIALERFSFGHTGKGIVRYPLEQIWHPRVSIVNETNSVSRRLPESVEVESDGTVTYRQRYAGAFTQPLRLQSFPFDRQTFRVQLVAVRYQSNEVMLYQIRFGFRTGLKGLAASRHLLPCQIGP